MKIPPISMVWRLAVTQTFARLTYGSIGGRSIVYRPMFVAGRANIRIGRRTVIRNYARLEVVRRVGVPWVPALTIGDEVNVEQGVHIVCQCEISIGNRVSIAPYCVLLDNDHPHDPPIGSKIGSRWRSGRSYVRIKDGSLIGAHCVILPNVTIGSCAVIGAGSVVTRDVPDYSVAVGAPARVVKTFNPSTGTWSSVS